MAPSHMARAGPAAAGTGPLESDRLGGAITTPTKQPSRQNGKGPRESTITVELIVRPTPRRVGRAHAYLYSVRLDDGEVIIKDSPEPTFDLARALLARGITGSVKLIDAADGAHRITITDIAAAARLLKN